MAASLSARAFSRAKSGFRPNTQRNYDSMFSLFVGFCVFLNIALQQVTSEVLMAFMEFLIGNGASYSSVVNHMSAIKAILGLHGLPIHMFDSPKIKLFIKSVQMNRPISVSFPSIIDIPLLHKIIEVCDTMYMGQVFKALYLLAFYSFLHLSNLVPHASHQFDPSRHLARGDIILGKSSGKLLIKWSKTIQSRDRVKIIDLPFLSMSPLCPILALKVLLSLVPLGNNSPLFQIKKHGKWFPLTDSKVRYHFKLVLKKLGLDHGSLSFHSFRRSGASYVFNKHVRLQDIKAHGTWTSDSVWRYLVQDPSSTSSVALAFQSNLSSPTPT